MKNKQIKNQINRSDWLNKIFEILEIRNFQTVIFANKEFNYTKIT